MIKADPDNIAKVAKTSKRGSAKGERRGGRKKGTPNKRTADIVERLKGVDIVGELLEIARTTEKEETKVTVYKELMKYVYPQRKAVEMDVASGFVVNINNKAVEVERDKL